MNTPTTAKELADAVWSLGRVKENKSFVILKARLFACDCAEHVVDDDQLLYCINIFRHHFISGTTAHEYERAKELALLHTRNSWSCSSGSVTSCVDDYATLGVWRGHLLAQDASSDKEAETRFQIELFNKYFH